LLRYILLDTTLFDSADDVVATRKNLLWILESLIQRDQEYLRCRPRTPRLYESGVRYEAPKQFQGVCEEVRVLREALGRNAKRLDVSRVLDVVQEVLGGERFCDIGRILERGGIDCDGLSSWRVAELRQLGNIAARPYITHRRRPNGGVTYHALVLWPPFASVSYETSEDPSLLLGMGGENRVRDRAKEIEKNAERCEILRSWRGGRGASAIADASLSDVLGLRRGVQPGAAVAELDAIFRRAS